MLIEFAQGNNPNSQMMHVSGETRYFMIEEEGCLFFFTGTYYDVGDNWFKIINEIDIEKVIAHPDSEWTPDYISSICQDIINIGNSGSENCDFQYSDYCFDDVRVIPDQEPTMYISVGSQTVPIIEIDY